MIKLIFSTLGFAIAGVLLFTYIEPTYAQINVTKAQVAQYQGALDKAGQLQQLQQSLVQKYNSFNPNDLNRLQLMIPDSADNISLILELDSLASRYGLALTNVDVSSPGAPAAQTPSQIQGAVGGASTYSVITLHFTTFGTYDTYRSFMHDLEQSLRLVDLTNLSLAPAQIKSSGSANTYNFDTSVKTYWLK